MDFMLCEAPLDSSFQKERLELVNKGSLGRRRKPSRSYLKLHFSPSADLRTAQQGSPLSDQRSLPAVRLVVPAVCNGFPKTPPEGSPRCPPPSRSSKARSVTLPPPEATLPRTIPAAALTPAAATIILIDNNPQAARYLKRKQSDAAAALAQKKQSEAAVLIQTWERRTRFDADHRHKQQLQHHKQQLQQHKQQQRTRNRFQEDKENAPAAAAMPDSCICRKYTAGNLDLVGGVGRTAGTGTAVVRGRTRDESKSSVPSGRNNGHLAMQYESPLQCRVKNQRKVQEEVPEWVSLSRKLCAKFVEDHLDTSLSDSQPEPVAERTGNLGQVEVKTEVHPEKRKRQECSVPSVNGQRIREVSKTTSKLPVNPVAIKKKKPQDASEVRATSEEPPWINLSRKLCTKFIEQHLEYPEKSKPENKPGKVPNGDVRIVEKIGKVVDHKSRSRIQEPEWISLSRKLRAKFIESHIDDPETIALDNQLNVSDPEETNSESMSNASHENRFISIPSTEKVPKKSPSRKAKESSYSGVRSSSSISQSPEKEEICWEYIEDLPASPSDSTPHRSACSSRNNESQQILFDPDDTDQISFRDDIRNGSSRCCSQISLEDESHYTHSTPQIKTVEYRDEFGMQKKDSKYVEKSYCKDKNDLSPINKQNKSFSGDFYANRNTISSASSHDFDQSCISFSSEENRTSGHFQTVDQSHKSCIYSRNFSEPEFYTNDVLFAPPDPDVPKIELKKEVMNGGITVEFHGMNNLKQRSESRSKSIVVGSRSNSRVTDSRSNSIVAESRSNSSVTDSRSNSIVAESRSNSSVTDSRSNSVVAGRGSNSSVTDCRSNSIVAESRSNSSVTDSRSNSIVAERRSNSSVTDSRINSIVAGSKSNSSVTDSRSDSIVGESRSNSIVSESRSDSIVAESSVANNSKKEIDGAYFNLSTWEEAHYQSDSSDIGQDCEVEYTCNSLKKTAISKSMSTVFDCKESNNTNHHNTAACQHFQGVSQEKQKPHHQSESVLYKTNLNNASPNDVENVNRNSQESSRLSKVTLKCNTSFNNSRHQILEVNNSPKRKQQNLNGSINQVQNEINKPNKENKSTDSNKSYLNHQDVKETSQDSVETLSRCSNFTQECSKLSDSNQPLMLKRKYISRSDDALHKIVYDNLRPAASQQESRFDQRNKMNISDNESRVRSVHSVLQSDDQMSHDAMPDINTSKVIPLTKEKSFNESFSPNNTKCIISENNRNDFSHSSNIVCKPTLNKIISHKSNSIDCLEETVQQDSIDIDDDSFIEMESFSRRYSQLEPMVIVGKSDGPKINLKTFEYQPEVPVSAKLVSKQNGANFNTCSSTSSVSNRNESPNSAAYEDMFRETTSCPSDSETSSWTVMKKNTYYVNGRSSSMNDLDFSDCSLSVKCDYASSSNQSTIQSRRSSCASSSFYVNLRDYDSHMLEPGRKKEASKYQSNGKAHKMSVSNPPTPETLRNLFTSPLKAMHPPPNPKIIARMPPEANQHHYYAISNPGSSKHIFEPKPAKPKKTERSSSIKIKDIAHGIILTFRRFQNHSKSHVSPSHYVDVSHLAQSGNNNCDSDKGKKKNSHNKNRRNLSIENGKTDSDSGFATECHRARNASIGNDITAARLSNELAYQELNQTRNLGFNEKKKVKNSKKSGEKSKKTKGKSIDARTVPTVSRKVQQMADGTLYLVTTVSGDSTMPGVYSDSPDTSSELSLNRPVKLAGESNC